MINITRIPTESWNLTGLKGDKYPDFKVGPTCSVPGCNRLSDHAHHLVRRSFLGGPFNWVRMDDNVEIGNLASLCFSHHNDVTEGRDTITYDKGVFYWSNMEPLSQQPPIKTTEQTESREDTADDLGIGHVLAEGHNRETCPTCKRPMPKPKIETPMEQRKERSTWAVGVPVTERENGAETLDELLEACRDELDKAGLSYGDGNKVKFFVLSTAMALFVQHAEQVLSDS